MTSLPQFSVTSVVTVKVVDNVFRGLSSTLQLDGAFKIEAHVGGICSGLLVQRGSGFLTVYGALCGRQTSVCQNITTRHREEASEAAPAVLTAHALCVSCPNICLLWCCSQENKAVLHSSPVTVLGPSPAIP